MGRRKKETNEEASKNKAPKKQDIHPELEGFEISINSFGEIVRTIDIDQINSFLTKNLYDKKLRNNNAPHASSEDSDTNEEQDA